MGEPAMRAMHARLLADHRLQFDFSQTPAPPPLPQWLLAALQAIGKAIVWSWPGLQIAFWVALAGGVAAVVWLIGREWLGWRWPQRRRRPSRGRPATVDFTPEREIAHSLLADADALAAEGRFDAAVRLILRRSIDDIESRRPRLVRPALTAREISRLAALPSTARDTFAQMAAVVERSLFAGRELDRSDFAACRSAYEGFAFPETWL